MEQTLTTEETLDATAVMAAAPEVAAREDMQQLEKRAMSATFWTVLDYGLSQVLRVVNSLVLTHLLLPAAFGEMGLVMTLIVGVTLLSDVGLGPSIIQNQSGDDPRFLDTAWTIQVIRGLVLWAGACALAVPASWFYKDPALAKILPILALNTVLMGFNSTGLLTLSRHMGVRRLFAIDCSTQVFALVVTVTWAMMHASVWALVAGSLASNAFRLTLSHIPMLVPGHRNRFLLDKQSLAEIFKFGKWIFLGTALFFFASQADRLVMGRVVSMTTLGVYSIAFQISDVPRSVINAFSSRVGFPFAARLAHLPVEEFRARFLRYRMYVLMAGAALLSVMAAWGAIIIFKVYPPSYADAAWMIPVLAIGLWHTLLYFTTSSALLARGVSTYSAVGNGFWCAAMFLGIGFGYSHFGLLGAMVAIAAGDFPLYVVTEYGATRHGVKPLKQDALMTVFFLALLAANFALRHAVQQHAPWVFAPGHVGEWLHHLKGRL